MPHRSWDRLCNRVRRHHHVSEQSESRTWSSDPWHNGSLLIEHVRPKFYYKTLITKPCNKQQILDFVSNSHVADWFTLHLCTMSSNRIQITFIKSPPSRQRETTHIKSILVSSNGSHAARSTGTNQHTICYGTDSTCVQRIDLVPIYTTSQAINIKRSGFQAAKWWKSRHFLVRVCFCGSDIVIYTYDYCT